MGLVIDGPLYFILDPSQIPGEQHRHAFRQALLCAECLMLWSGYQGRHRSINLPVFFLIIGGSRVPWQPLLPPFPCVPLFLPKSVGWDARLMLLWFPFLVVLGISLVRPDSLLQYQRVLSFS